MTGTIDLTPDGKLLLIRFPYREDLVEEVRTIPGRRWDRGGKCWRVPSDRVDVVVDVFLKHGFAMAPEVTGLLAGTVEGGEPKQRGLFDPTRPEPEVAPALSISLLNERVRSALRGAFPEPVWVVGEVHDYDKAKGRRHAFFTLVEKRSELDEPSARAEVALFARTAEKLAKILHDGEGGLTLRDGIEIRALVRVDLYPQTGRFQLVIENIDPSHTLGKMALSREQILAELRAAGLADRNAELPLPLPPLRVGVLSSLDSDGWTDFTQELESSGLGFQVTGFDIRVQGTGLRPTMLAGLRWFAERAGEFDVLCVLRGGGSKTDLAGFDDRELALAVARHPLKIVCGIGHQRDQSVLDLITHSEKTPTAVGDLLIDTVRTAQQRLAEAGRRLQQAAQRRGSAGRRRISLLARAVQRATVARLAGDRQRVAGQAPRLLRGAAALLERRRNRAATACHALATRTRMALERQRARLDQHTARQRLLDPERVLERGYTLVRSTDGRIVTRAATLQKGSTIDIAFRDGRARATTTKIELEDQAEDLTA